MIWQPSSDSIHIFIRFVYKNSAWQWFCAIFSLTFDFNHYISSIYSASCKMCEMCASCCSIYKCRNIITTVVSVVVLVMLWATAIFANLQHYHPSKLTLRLVQDLHITCFCTRLVLLRRILNNRFVIIIIIMQLDFESL